MHSRDLPAIRSATRRRPAIAGFTVMEVLLALLLIAIGTLGLARFFPPAPMSASRSMEDARASQLAATTMTRLLDSTTADPTLSPGGHADDRNPHERIYYVSWNVDDNQPIASCKRITVTVRWPAANSSSSVRLVAVTPATK